MWCKQEKNYMPCTERMCWLNASVRIAFRNFDLKVASRSARPVEADGGQIKALVHANRYVITWEIAGRLNLHNRIKLLFFPHQKNPLPYPWKNEITFRTTRYWKLNLLHCECLVDLFQFRQTRRKSFGDSSRVLTFTWWTLFF